MKNEARRYIAGMDALEEWDARQMARLGLEPQRILAPQPAQALG